MENKKTTQCLNPNHDMPKEVYLRGLCHNCYSTALKVIKDGKTTWDALEAKGRALAPKKKAATGATGWLLG